MSINAISSSAQHSPVQQSSRVTPAQTQKVDSDGDHDNGATKQSLQLAAQPHLGLNVNLKA